MVARDKKKSITSGASGRLTIVVVCQTTHKEKREKMGAEEIKKW